MKRTIATAAVLLGLLAGRALATAPEAPAPARADVTFGGVRFWDFKGSELAGVGTARTLVYDRSASEGTAHTIQADLPGLHGDPRPVHLEAGVARGHLAARTLDADSGVTAQRQDGTARSNSAHYDGHTRVASGSEPVSLASTRFQATGRGFTLASDTGVVDLDGPVDAHGEAQR